MKPLTDRDRDEIRKTIYDKTLRRESIEFRSTAVHASDDQLAVEGELTLAGSTRPVSARLTLGAAGRLTGTIPVVVARSSPSWRTTIRPSRCSSTPRTPSR